MKNEASLTIYRLHIRNLQLRSTYLRTQIKERASRGRVRAAQDAVRELAVTREELGGAFRKLNTLSTSR